MCFLNKQRKALNSRDKRGNVYSPLFFLIKTLHMGNFDVVKTVDLCM